MSGRASWKVGSQERMHRHHGPAQPAEPPLWNCMAAARRFRRARYSVTRRFWSYIGGWISFSKKR